jgi:LytS/YehU family sensor histidine kinase
MFNALTSIQNLVNKNDIEGANHYLSKFAGLTRQVLDTGNDELLSLEQEITILADYLQMEQLRFGFKYEIKVDEALNKANTDIPAMLLQPFVENAVKHGVAVLKEAGIIKISIIREAKDIIFAIKDNGKWINQDSPGEINGYGVKLSEERVALLNQLYKDQPVSLNIDTQGPGTVVSIRLSNWI